MNEPSQIRVRIGSASGEQEVRVRAGLGFQGLCARHRTPIEFDCRKADCGICIVRIDAGADNLSAPTPSEADFLQAMRAASNERLACQTRILGDVAVWVDDPI